MSDNRKTEKPGKGKEPARPVTSNPSTPESRRAPTRPSPFESPSATTTASPSSTTLSIRPAPRAPTRSSPTVRRLAAVTSSPSSRRGGPRPERSLDDILRSTRERAESQQSLTAPQTNDAPAASSSSSLAAAAPSTSSPGSSLPAIVSAAIAQGSTPRAMPPIDHSRNHQDFTAENFVGGRPVDERAAFAPGSMDDLIRRQLALSQRVANRIQQNRDIVNAKYTVVAQEGDMVEAHSAELQRRVAAVAARERDVEDREIDAEWRRRVLHWRGGYIVNRLQALGEREQAVEKKEQDAEKKPPGKKTGGFFGLQVRHGAVSRLNERHTRSDRIYDGDVETMTQSSNETGSTSTGTQQQQQQSDRAYDGDVDTLTLSSNDAGPASASNAGRHAGGTTSSSSGNAAASPTPAWAWGAIPLNARFEFHNSVLENHELDSRSDSYILSDATYERPQRGRPVTSPRHDEQALSAIAAVFTPRADQAAVQDTGASSLEHAPDSSSDVSTSTSTPASAGMVSEADETAAKASGPEYASIYQDAQENVSAEDQSVPSRDLRRVPGKRNLSASYQGKGKEKSQD